MPHLHLRSVVGRRPNSPKAQHRQSTVVVKAAGNANESRSTKPPLGVWKPLTTMAKMLHIPARRSSTNSKAAKGNERDVKLPQKMASRQWPAARDVTATQSDVAEQSFIVHASGTEQVNPAVDSRGFEPSNRSGTSVSQAHQHTPAVSSPLAQQSIVAAINDAPVTPAKPATSIDKKESSPSSSSNPTTPEQDSPGHASTATSTPIKSSTANTSPPSSPHASTSQARWELAQGLVQDKFTALEKELIKLKRQAVEDATNATKSHAADLERVRHDYSLIGRHVIVNAELEAKIARAEAKHLRQQLAQIVARRPKQDDGAAPVHCGCDRDRKHGSTNGDQQPAIDRDVTPKPSDYRRPEKPVDDKDGNSIDTLTVQLNAVKSENLTLELRCKQAEKDARDVHKHRISEHKCMEAQQCDFEQTIDGLQEAATDALAEMKTKQETAEKRADALKKKIDEHICPATMLPQDLPPEHQQLADTNKKLENEYARILALNKLLKKGNDRLVRSDELSQNQFKTFSSKAAGSDRAVHEKNATIRRLRDRVVKQAQMLNEMRRDVGQSRYAEELPAQAKHRQAVGGIIASDDDEQSASENLTELDFDDEYDEADFEEEKEEEEAKEPVKTISDEDFSDTTYMYDAMDDPPVDKTTPVPASRPVERRPSSSSTSSVVTVIENATQGQSTPEEVLEPTPASRRSSYSSSASVVTVVKAASFSQQTRRQGDQESLSKSQASTRSSSCSSISSFVTAVADNKDQSDESDPSDQSASSSLYQQGPMPSSPATSLGLPEGLQERDAMFADQNASKCGLSSVTNMSAGEPEMSRKLMRDDSKPQVASTAVTSTSRPCASAGDETVVDDSDSARWSAYQLDENEQYDEDTLQIVPKDPEDLSTADVKEIAGILLQDDAPAGAGSSGGVTARTVQISDGSIAAEKLTMPATLAATSSKAQTDTSLATLVSPQAPPSPITDNRSGPYKDPLTGWHQSAKRSAQTNGDCSGLSPPSQKKLNRVNVLASEKGEASEASTPADGTNVVLGLPTPASRVNPSTLPQGEHGPSSVVNSLGQEPSSISADGKVSSSPNPTEAQNATSKWVEELVRLENEEGARTSPQDIRAAMGDSILTPDDVSECSDDEYMMSGALQSLGDHLTARQHLEVFLEDDDPFSGCFRKRPTQIIPGYGNASSFVYSEVPKRVETEQPSSTPACSASAGHGTVRLPTLDLRTVSATGIVAKIPGPSEPINYMYGRSAIIIPDAEGGNVQLPSAQMVMGILAGHTTSLSEAGSRGQHLSITPSPPSSSTSSVVEQDNPTCAPVEPQRNPFAPVASATVVNSPPIPFNLGSTATKPTNGVFTFKSGSTNPKPLPRLVDPHATEMNKVLEWRRNAAPQQQGPPRTFFPSNLTRDGQLRAEPLNKSSPVSSSKARSEPEEATTKNASQEKESSSAAKETRFSRVYRQRLQRSQGRDVGGRSGNVQPNAPSHGKSTSGQMGKAEGAANDDRKPAAAEAGKLSRNQERYQRRKRAQAAEQSAIQKRMNTSSAHRLPDNIAPRQSDPVEAELELKAVVHAGKQSAVADGASENGHASSAAAGLKLSKLAPRTPRQYDGLTKGQIRSIQRKALAERRAAETAQSGIKNTGTMTETVKASTDDEQASPEDVPTSTEDLQTTPENLEVSTDDSQVLTENATASTDSNKAPSTSTRGVWKYTRFDWADEDEANAPIFTEEPTVIANEQEQKPTPAQAQSPSSDEPPPAASSAADDRPTERIPAEPSSSELPLTEPAPIDSSSAEPLYAEASQTTPEATNEKHKKPNTRAKRRVNHRKKEKADKYAANAAKMEANAYL